MQSLSPYSRILINIPAAVMPCALLDPHQYHWETRLLFPSALISEVVRWVDSATYCAGGLSFWQTVGGLPHYPQDLSNSKKSLTHTHTHARTLSCSTSLQTITLPWRHYRQHTATWLNYFTTIAALIHWTDVRVLLCWSVLERVKIN